MSRFTSCLAVVCMLGAGACATDRPAQTSSAVSDQPNATADKGFASPAECNQVANHLFTMYEHHGSAPASRPTEVVTSGDAPYYQGLYNDFMAQCTTKLSHKDASCVLDAPSYQQIRVCQIENGTPLILGTRGPARF